MGEELFFVGQSEKAGLGWAGGPPDRGGHMKLVQRLDIQAETGAFLGL